MFSKITIYDFLWFPCFLNGGEPGCVNESSSQFGDIIVEIVNNNAFDNTRTFKKYKIILYITTEKIASVLSKSLSETEAFCSPVCGNDRPIT